MKKSDVQNYKLYEDEVKKLLVSLKYNKQLTWLIFKGVASYVPIVFNGRTPFKS